MRNLPTCKLFVSVLVPLVSEGAQEINKNIVNALCFIP